MEKFQQNLERYADLAIRFGVNVQKGQTLVINAPLSSKEFIHKAVQKAYEAGVKNVHVEWNDDELTRMKYQLASDEAFNEFPLWKAKGYEELAENDAAFLSIISSNPELLKGINPDRIAAANKAAGFAMATYHQYIQADKVSWSKVAVPSKEWAKKVFPDTAEDEAVQLLWEAIFMATRIDQENPVQTWKEHDQNLQTKADYLNGKRYKKLHYKSPGTDLTVELPDEHVWIGGGGISKSGQYFMANIPTEEVFTVPLKEGVNGTVTSSKPLTYGGNLIENFTLTFENGRIVDINAQAGYETLKRLVETDEGSHYLGEVALVPDNSPISQSNIIFYNTLFDENASNHFAIGNAYASCLEGGNQMSKEELDKNQVNSSIIHVDFMIGSAAMDIDGELADGTKEPIFRNGNWTF
ncbi:aminopeptidase [Peribacillus butanolivorans]|uniref:aminopeptidase n=1 Tax=Peribacillus TaxID=2675229 RepID=UPI00207C61F6|nr:aminopeptidase [Peribacillus butanolivorans]MCO0597946.1 aminopeptidase [Peribacillus butanolivorans]